MSLINEALKKAQRAHHSDPAAGTPPVRDDLLGERVPRRGHGPGTKTVLLISLATICACALIVAAAILLLGRRTDAPTVVTAAPETVTVSPASATDAPSAPEPVVSVPSGPAEQSVATISTSIPPAPDPTAPIVTPAPSPVAVVPAPTQTAQPSPESAPAAEAPAAPRVVPSTPTRNPDVIEFLDRVRVAGVRASGTDPRVLMNDRVYRLEEVVNRGLGLRLTGIRASMLTFVDDSGYEYTKSF